MIGKRLIAAGTALLSFAPSVPARAQAEPGFRATVQGALFDAYDMPVSASLAVRARIFAAPERTTVVEEPLFAESAARAIQVSQGLFALDTEPVPAAAFEGRATVYVELEIEGQRMRRIAWNAPLLARRARAAGAAVSKTHCDCVKVALGATGGEAACADGRVLAGVYAECTNGGPTCVSAIHCCRLCE